MEYVVEAKTRKQLRELAHILRRHLEVEDVLYFPIVEDIELPNGIHTDVTTGHIRIKESVYNGACEGVGRDRMTIAHEIGHTFLHYVFAVSNCKETIIRTKNSCIQYP